MPSWLRHRVIMTVAMVAGAIVWGSIAAMLRAADGSSGVALMSTQINIFEALGLVMLAGIPAVLLAVPAAISGRGTSGVLVLALSLCGLAVGGGSSDGWMWRSDLPGDYAWLIGEMVLWQAVMIGGIVLIGLGAEKLCHYAPSVAHWRGEGQRGVDFNFHFGADSILAVITCTLVSLAAAWLLLRTAQIGQIIGALIVAFAFGAFIARVAAPKANAMALLVSPMLVAIIAYACVLLRFDHDAGVLAAWYALTGPAAQGAAKLPGPALALPIHYASAGLAGCCLGIGFSTPPHAEDEDDEDTAPRRGLAALIHAVRGDAATTHK